MNFEFTYSNKVRAEFNKTREYKNMIDHPTREYKVFSDNEIIDKFLSIAEKAWMECGDKKLIAAIKEFIASNEFYIRDNAVVVEIGETTTKDLNDVIKAANDNDELIIDLFHSFFPQSWVLNFANHWNLEK